MKIWLDDIREAPDGWYWAKNVKDCIWQIQVNFCDIDEISLDNDLGENQLEGRKVVLWLAEQYASGKNFWPEKIHVHSSNTVAVEYMEAMINRYKPN